MSQVGLAHDHLGFRALVCGYGIVQVQTAGCVLLEQGTDTLQVALSLQLQGLVLVELGLGSLHVGLVGFRVYDEQYLTFLDVCALFKEHLFKIALDTGAYLHELLCADPAGVVSVDLHVVDDHRLRLHYRVVGFRRLRPCKYDPYGSTGDYQAEYYKPCPFGPFADFLDSGGRYMARPGNLLCRYIDLHNGCKNRLN